MTVIDVAIDRCEGHGLCEQAAPQVYRLTDDGLVEVIPGDDSPERRAQAEAGARLCPVNALKVTSAPSP